MNREQIIRRRMHGLYLSRKCGDLAELSRNLLGMHSWFYRNVAFSAVIRGADIGGWKTVLTKTWLYGGRLHGAAYDELPRLLALSPGDEGFWGDAQMKAIADEAISLMEDGVSSRAEMRRIFAGRYDHTTLETAFSPWGGIFVNLARLGRVAFRDMASHDFDLVDREPMKTQDEVLPGLLRDYITAYGPATLADAAWFFNFWREDKVKLKKFNVDEFSSFKYDGDLYFYIDDPEGMNDIPEVTLLSGFDPLIVSYSQRSRFLPDEYKSSVILKSGICNPTVAVNGRVEGLWNIKKGEPALEFFSEQPKRVRDAAYNLLDEMRWETAGRL